MPDFIRILADFFSWKRMLAVALGFTALHSYQGHHVLGLLVARGMLHSLPICCRRYR